MASAPGVQQFGAQVEVRPFRIIRESEDVGGDDDPLHPQGGEVVEEFAGGPGTALSVRSSTVSLCRLPCASKKSSGSCSTAAVKTRIWSALFAPALSEASARPGSPGYRCRQRSQHWRGGARIHTRPCSSHGVFLVAVRGRQVENERVYGGWCQGQVAVTGGVPILGCSFRVRMAVGEEVGVDRRARSNKRQTVPFRGPAQTRHRRAECLGPRRIPRRRSASPPAHPESRPADVWPRLGRTVTPVSPFNTPSGPHSHETLG
jgi:hypothetical protein